MLQTIYDVTYVIWTFPKKCIKGSCHEFTKEIKNVFIPQFCSVEYDKDSSQVLDTAPDFSDKNQGPQRQQVENHNEMNQTRVDKEHESRFQDGYFTAI